MLLCTVNINRRRGIRHDAAPFVGLYELIVIVGAEGLPMTAAIPNEKREISNTTADSTAVSTALRLAWSSPKLERRTTPSAGDGLFAIAPIGKNELLIVWGGLIVTREQLVTLPMFAQHRSIQVEENHYLCSAMLDDDADCINHSCEPNAGLSGQMTLIALRNIEPGEEICFDYAMSDGDPDYYMECACGSPACRGAVTGNDWRDPVLQRRYKGFFSPYLQRRIDAMFKRHRRTG
jgi:uncharacterized protein